MTQRLPILCAMLAAVLLVPFVLATGGGGPAIETYGDASGPAGHEHTSEDAGVRDDRHAHDDHVWMDGEWLHVIPEPDADAPSWDDLRPLARALPTLGLWHEDHGLLDPARLPTLAGHARAAVASGDTPLGSSHGATITVNVSEDRSPFYPYDPINETAAFNATHDGLHHRAFIQGPFVGQTNWTVVLYEPNGDRWADCTGTVGTAGVTYAEAVVVCYMDVDLDEWTVAQWKIRRGDWTLEAYWDDVLHDTRTVSMATPSIRTGGEDWIQAGDRNGRTVKNWWTMPTYHNMTFTFNNSGDSPAYTKRNATSNVWIDLDAPGNDAFSVKDFGDFNRVVYTSERADMYARDIPAGGMFEIELNYTAGNVYDDPPSYAFSGLLRLTPNIWLWEGGTHENPVVVTLDDDHAIWFYSDFVNPDPARPPDPAWDATLFVVDKALDLHQHFTNVYQLPPPSNVDGRTFMGFYDAIGYCGLGGSNGGVVDTTCERGRLGKMMHVYAMEIHHAVYYGFSFGGGDKNGIVEGCAQVAQEYANQTWNLQTQVSQQMRFLRNEPGRDPYVIGYGHSYYLCDMWMELRGNDFQLDMAEELDDATARGAWEDASRVNGTIGEAMWRFYVNDRHPWTMPTRVEAQIMNLGDPAHDVRTGAFDAVIGDIDPGDLWIQEFVNFDGDRYAVTVGGIPDLFGGGYKEMHLYGWDANAQEPWDEVVSLNLPTVIPGALTDDPDDEVALIVLGVFDPALVDQNSFTVDFRTV